MDKKSSQPIRSGHVAMKETKGEFSSSFWPETCSRERRAQNSKIEGFQRESVQLLYRIPDFRTVGFLRAKKQIGSTQRGLRVGTGFEEFIQTS